MTAPAKRSEERPPPASGPLVLCAGIAVLDFVFRMARFPTPATKSPTQEFVVIGGGCAANAAITIARLGGRAQFCGPLGDDAMSHQIVEGLVGAGVDVGGIVRVPGAETCVSGIFIDADGERLLTTRREHGLTAARLRDPDSMAQDVDAVLADNHFGDLVLPLCRAAARRGIPVVLDIDKPTSPADPLLACATHAIFSAEALHATTGISGCETALARAAEFCPGLVAVTDGANGVRWRDRQDGVRHLPAFAVQTIDTLAAGDVFHGAFALALAEGRDEVECMRFASAAAAIKCTRFGGIAGVPARAEVEELSGSTRAR